MYRALLALVLALTAAPPPALAIVAPANPKPSWVSVKVLRTETVSDGTLVTLDHGSADGVTRRWSARLVTKKNYEVPDVELAIVRIDRDALVVKGKLPTNFIVNYRIVLVKP